MSLPLIQRQIGARLFMIACLPPHPDEQKPAGG